MLIVQRLYELVVDESGQDIIEYGLLAAIIATAGILLMPQIQAGMNVLFTSSETGAYNDWCPSDPVAQGGAVCSTE